MHLYLQICLLEKQILSLDAIFVANETRDKAYNHSYITKRYLKNRYVRFHDIF